MTSNKQSYQLHIRTSPHMSHETRHRQKNPLPSRRLAAMQSHEAPKRRCLLPRRQATEPCNAATRSHPTNRLPWLHHPHCDAAPRKPVTSAPPQHPLSPRPHAATSGRPPSAVTSASSRATAPDRARPPARRLPGLRAARDLAGAVRVWSGSAATTSGGSGL